MLKFRGHPRESFTPASPEIFIKFQKLKLFSNFLYDPQHRSHTFLDFNLKNSQLKDAFSKIPEIPCQSPKYPRDNIFCRERKQNVTSHEHPPPQKSHKRNIFIIKAPFSRQGRRMFSLFTFSRHNFPHSAAFLSCVAVEDTRSSSAELVLIGVWKEN